MRYLVKIGELGKKIDYLDNQLSIIDKNIEQLNKIKSTIIWEGEASIKFYDSLDEYIIELKIIASNILDLIKYLLAYHDRYSLRYSDLRRKYAKYDKEVNKWD